jgi:transcription elongation factor Elf1
MFLFFGGTRVRHKSLGEGHFHCPTCDRSRVYERRRLGNWLHAYWVPLFRVKDLGEVIVCRTCGQAFEGPGGRPVET